MRSTKLINWDKNAFVLLIEVLKNPKAIIFKKTSIMKVIVHVISSHFISRVVACSGSFEGLRRSSMIKLATIKPVNKKRKTV